MKRLRKQQLSEQFIYLAIWLAVFLAPLIGAYYVVNSGVYGQSMWQEVFRAWRSILPFFLLFLVNNYLLVSRFLFRKKYLAYATCLVALIALSFIILPTPARKHFPGEFAKNKPFEQRMDNKERMERMHKEGVPSRGDRPDSLFLEESKEPPPTNNRGRRADQMPQKQFRGEPSEPFLPEGGPPLRFPPLFPFIHIITAFLLVGFNIAIKLFFKSLRDEETLKELERQHLQSELQYLKYQINPHFFMNTLNNIHALVDIDAHKAKSSIIELSKLMRYILYEASNNTIQLSREVQFLTNYVALMRLRYIDKVAIRMELPPEIPDVQIPPLLFISLLENAFKHGVSYRVESFVEVIMQLEEGGSRISFRCRNSNHGKAGEQHHGIGLENVRKRLKLLFGNAYTLSIKKDTASFEILLIIPL
ncbi:MAG TPA: histidine kinase [Bacteroides reticulotermitis]|nr:histidine kinase [Bacteroides reticulotermitis]